MRNLAKKGQYLLQNRHNLLFRSGRFLKHKSQFYLGCLPRLPDDLRIMGKNKIKSSIIAEPGTRQQALRKTREKD